MLLPEAISNFANQGGSGDPRCDGASLGEDIKNDLATPNGFGSYTMYETAGLCPSNRSLRRSRLQRPMFESMVQQSLWHRRLVGTREIQRRAFRTYWSWDVINPGVPDSYEVISDGVLPILGCY